MPQPRLTPEQISEIRNSYKGYGEISRNTDKLVDALRASYDDYDALKAENDSLRPKHEPEVAEKYHQLVLKAATIIVLDPGADSRLRSLAELSLEFAKHFDRQARELDRLQQAGEWKPRKRGLRMSYDVYLEMDTGGPEPVCIDNDHNYTYNVSPMFYRAFRGDEGLNGLDGMPAAEAVGQLEHAIGVLKSPERREEFEAMNPPNKWGNHKGAIKFLEGILADCKAHPKAVVRIC